MTPKYIEYDGLKFCRDDKTGYYLNSTIRKRLHRYVWEKERGEIPKGYHIHHVDKNKANNDISNLALISASDHEKLHGAEEERKILSRKCADHARKFAIEWHKSEAGRKWHSENATGRKAPRVTKTCEVCGKEFQGTKTQRFCSNNCKSKYRRMTKADNITAICGVCGKEFTTNKYKPSKYCCRECASKAHIGWYERKVILDTN